MYLRRLILVNLTRNYSDKKIHYFLLRFPSRAKCTVIVRLLNFITALWTKYPLDTLRSIDTSFYNNDLTKLIFTCTLNPTQLGFDINNEEINKKLPDRVRIRDYVVHWRFYCINI